MNANDYMPYWDAVRTPMTEKMQDIVAKLQSTLPAHLSVSPVDTDVGSSEFKVFSDIRVKADTSILNLDFVLLDGEENGAEGLGIALNLTGYNSLVLGGYAPAAYSDEAFTFDKDELLSRVAQLDTGEFVDYIMSSALLSEKLKQEALADGHVI